jgi:chloramphenicol O-acetyltransferase type A
MDFHLVDIKKYYQKDVLRHFSEDCKCSLSMTARIDVTDLKQFSVQTETKFYVNFLYLLAKVLNSREDYRMVLRYPENDLVCYDRINPAHYVFHEDTETCTPVYSVYDPAYDKFYAACMADIVKAKKSREYGLDAENHINWFDASYISWVSYDSMNLELPDGYLYFQPIINWGRYREESGRLMMPLTVRMNHAIADGFLVANVFRLLEMEIGNFTGKPEGVPNEI